MLERDYSKPSGTGKAIYWICRCKCGNICSIRQDKLLNNLTKSCGCLKKELDRSNNWTNKRFGKLVVVKRDLTKPIGKNKPAYWICKCDCGNVVSIRADHLINCTTESCGCINSKGELKIRQLLDEIGLDFKQQVSFNDLVGKNNHKLFFDFGIYKNNELFCLIEYQGLQHYKPYYFDSQERFNKRKLYDKLKKEYYFKI